ncbi:glutactin-like [Teleopsis dalmanni]|uniref:glutactin-like n=1 Tax=Teleopsis dalmanni TaxID=139649 RepID=UPI0018CF4F5B|nr:glutactin-like [Teleopsis dalmanni]
MKGLVAGFSIGILVIVCIVTAAQYTTSLKYPSVTVDIQGQGSVLGDFDTTLWTNQKYMQFRGIPYAESPRGKLRFKAPVARLPWRQIFDATRYGRRCPVITTVSNLTAQELKADLEDCLNLSVFTKDLITKRPVMFYIYGGGFYNGSASDHPPKHLLEKDIVLVVSQYRVGALGWLTTFTHDMPGNAPFMDILLALKWVQDHISDFGGDPDNVTVFGQSAGAAMTSALLLSPKSTGLFKRVIVQSGSILGHWAINSDPRKQTERICEALNCGVCKRNDELYDCLSKATVLDILEVTQAEDFALVINDVYGNLPEHPIELMKSYNRSIPVMTGFTKDDGSFVLATYYDGMKAAIGNMSLVKVRQFADGIMNLVNDRTRLSNNLLTRLLFTPQILNGTAHKEALPAYFDLCTTIYIKSPVIALTTQLKEKNLADIYLYSFDYEGQNTRFGYELGNEHYPFNGGVHHSNDNIYLFSTHSLNDNDTRMAQKMVELWTSFAIDGIPSSSEGPPILPMNSPSGPYFHINNEITISNDVLDELTSTLDDPDNKKIDRENIEF